MQEAKLWLLFYLVLNLPVSNIDKIIKELGRKLRFHFRFLPFSVIAVEERWSKKELW